MSNIKPRKKVGLSQESALELMQEIYTEIVDERNRALQTFKKFSRSTDENTDIAMVGKITNELLKIVDGAIEKKIRLLKIQTDILYKTGKTGGDDEKDFKLNEDMTSMIHKEIKDGLKAVESADNEIKYE
jgi:hypothetical protein